MEAGEIPRHLPRGSPQAHRGEGEGWPDRGDHRAGEGRARGERQDVLLRALRAARGRQRHARSRLMPKRVIRYAVVGCGHIAQVAVLPAFGNARRNSKLAAIVSGDPVKREALKKKYEVER